MQSITYRARKWRRTAAVLGGLMSALAALPVATAAQGRGGGHGRESRGGRDGGGRERGDQGGRHERNAESHRFTRSTEGRRFDNGVTLRRGTYDNDRHFGTYFPNRYYSYPHYAPGRSVSVDVVFSPFHFYYGVFPPYIRRGYVYRRPPARIFIDIPLYVGNDYRDYADRQDDYYLRQRNADNRWKADTDLRNTVYDLEDGFRNEDITLLTPLTDPKTQIAIFEKGRYEYSIDPNDYLDMTRDFMRTAHTTDFEVYRVHYKARDVYQAFARHTYRDANGKTRIVHLCFVLERLDDRWTITQIDSAPDRLD